ncbi:MAG: hypothetical protein ACXAB7_04515 [Candidatus Kariarchaeaceae archaeon]
MEDFTSDIDALFEESDSFVPEEAMTNILYIGPKQNYLKFENIIKQWTSCTCSYSPTIDEAIVHLLQEIFVIVILDSQSKDMDTVAISRIVRMNHPLARIIVLINKRRASLIFDITNQGAADAVLEHPLKKDHIYKMITEQQAKHDINKMMTSFVSKPPKLSKASYLLHDPSLSFQDESVAAKFIGIMITHESVPRYSRFFEDFLAKDEVLFASFLSGITMLGDQLFASKEPLKEINFGGVSVIFRFQGETQFSIFVQNLTNHNVKEVETIVDSVVRQLVAHTLNYFKKTKGHVSKPIQQDIKRITDAFKLSRQEVETLDSAPNLYEEMVLIYGSDDKNHHKIKRFLENKFVFRVFATEQEEESYKIIRNTNCNVILLDSKIGLRKDVRDALDFAEHAKELKPYLQIIYRVRDRRVTSNLISGLNSGLIDFMVPYRSPFKELSPWIIQALEKVTEIKEKSIEGQSIDSTLDPAAIVKTMIRKDEPSYRQENIPLLMGVFISQREHPVYQKMWVHGDNVIDYDQNMMAGLVAALDNVGEEMFYEDKPIGGFELGGARILVQQRESFNFVFFVKNLDPNTSVVVNKQLMDGTDQLFYIVTQSDEDLYSYEVQENLERSCETIHENFLTRFKE